MDDIIIDDKLKKELPTDDPNAMYNRKRAVELAPTQQLNKHQKRQLRKKNLLEAPKSKSSEKKQKQKEARRKLLEKYNRREEKLKEQSKFEVSKESMSLIKPTSSIGTKTSLRQRYNEALKRKGMGLSYDESIINSVEKKKASSKIVDDDNEPIENVNDSSSDDEEISLKPKEKLVEPPASFTPLIKVTKETPSIDDDTQKSLIEQKMPPEPRLAINVPLKRPEGIDEIRSKLPIIGEEQGIVETIHENDVVIVCGETGSGKTTQIPQFLYEAGYGTLRTHGKIAITEPRRVAAINMSKRVAYEMGLQWGEKVGYQIRNNKLYKESTVIKFCTDGILLREAEEDLLLSKYSVIIIDEAHERTINTDVLIGLLSRIVLLRRKKVENGEIGVERLKLIIMSATLRVDDFLKNDRLFEVEPPLINIDARQFPVNVHFSRVTPREEERLDAVIHYVEMIHEKMPPGGILVFLPGKDDINFCVSYFKSNYPQRPSTSSTIKNKTSKKDEKNEAEIETKPIEEIEEIEKIEEEDINEILDFRSKVDILDRKPMLALPLYSLLPQEEQDKVFKEHPKNIRLVVFSTNIAETSVTIPNIKYVVDLGLEKCRQFDFVLGVTKTKVDFISQASAEQRKGRAGRTGPGHCFRLYSSAQFMRFDEFTKPEIQRKPITEVVLLLKTMGLTDISLFPFPTLITKENLEHAETTLKHIGLLEIEPPFCVTTLGKLVSQFPLEPRLGKLIVGSKKLDIVEYAIILAAGLDVREPFISNKKPQEALISKRGDPFTLLNVFGAYLWEKDKEKFCRENNVRIKAMEEIQQIRQQITTIIWKTDKECLKSGLAGKIEPKAGIETLLAFCLFNSFCDHVAIHDGKGNMYTTADNKKCEIPGNSCLFDKKAKYITYISIDEKNDQKRFNSVTKILPNWINQVGSKLYLNRKSLGPPKYYPEEDAVMAKAESTFGQPNWRLPETPIPHPEPYRAFAAALLEGRVIPQLAQFTTKLISNPSDLENTNRNLPQRLLLIAFELKKEEIASRKALQARWDKEPMFLLPQILMWYPDKSIQSKITQNWPFKSATGKTIELSYSESDSD